MKFGRKSRESNDPVEAVAATTEDSVPSAERGEPLGPGPHDIDELGPDGDGLERVDLGGLLVAPAEGLDLRLQVDEATKSVQSVMVVGPEGAVELRAFAAARNGDLWSDVRRQIASEASRRGGTATERDGRWGPELDCELQVTAPDGRAGRQPQRVIGVNGPRWFVRATIVGKPARDPEAAGPFEEVVANLVVRRGNGAMAPGDPLPMTIPQQARRMS